MIRVYASEIDLQKTVIKYLGLVLPQDRLIHHSPNEGNHKVQYFAKQKLMGVLAGFPDIMILLRNTKPLFIELKQPKNYPTEQQRDVGTNLIGLGCDYAICRSLSDVQRFLEGVKPSIELVSNGFARGMINAEELLQGEIDNEKQTKKRAKEIVKEKGVCATSGREG
tara:strand:+ start:1283 stop:1783 length:501 start_codon:yes stop_codon:yes gene_type:complete